MRADRLISTLMLLQARGRITAQELAAELEVSERTVYRDIEALSMAGIPLYADRGPGGGFSLMESYRSSLTALTEADMRALLAMSVPAPLGDLGLDRPIKDALLKLLAALPGSAASVEASRIHIDSRGWFQTPERTPHLDTVYRAICETRKLHQIYRRADGTLSERVVEPHGLVAKTHVWYMVANTPDGMRTYRAARLQQVALLDEPFERLRDFDLAAYWQSVEQNFLSNIQTYAVRARFAPWTLERLGDIYGPWMQAQIDAATPDSAGWLVLDVEYESHEDALRFLLSWGAGVEVLAPADLRTSMQQVTRQMAALYTGA